MVPKLTIHLLEGDQDMVIGDSSSVSEPEIFTGALGGFLMNGQSIPLVAASR
jgi:hypothetical protein